MKHLTIIVPNGENNLSSIVGPFKIFSRANLLWKRKMGYEMFSIQLAGLSNEIGYYDGLFSINPHVQLSAVKKTDLVIIPSLNHNYSESVAANSEVVEWVKDQYKHGAAVASICTGAFLLAASGLLDGKTCSTHWSAAHDFRERFPEVKLQTDHLITDEQGIYTNGGAYSFLNLMIYLVEKYFDREIAIMCSKIFQIEMDRNTQSQFAIFTGQKRHDDAMVQQAQAFIEDHIGDKISFEQMSAEYAVSRRSFDRRFIRATGNTPLEYAQRVKIESAKKALESTRKNINEVMYDVGYSDVKAFREVFRKITGMSPLAYRERFHKDAV